MKSFALPALITGWFACCTGLLVGCSQSDAPESSTASFTNTTSSGEQPPLKSTVEEHGARTGSFSADPKPSSGLMPHALSQQGRSRAQVEDVESRILELEVSPSDPGLREELRDALENAHAYRTEMLERAKSEP
jgi:hypothetical protein